MAALRNLQALHQREEAVRGETLAYIESIAELKEELSLVHAAMDHLIALLKGYEYRSEDELTIQELGVRMVNIAGGVLKLGLSGYYQVAFQVTRDLLETTNLLDLFLTEQHRIADWRNADDKTRKKSYQPAHVRLALEKHSDKVGQRRDGPYSLLSEYAAHPTPVGGAMLRQDGFMQVGPFVSERLVKAFLEELAMRLGHGALVFSMHFEDLSQELLEHKAGFLALMENWRACRFPRHPSG